MQGRSLETGTEIRAMEECCLWIALHGLLSLLSHTIGILGLTDGIVYNRVWTTYISQLKICPIGLPTSQCGRGNILIEFLYLNNSRLCYVDIKTSEHTRKSTNFLKIFCYLRLSQCVLIMCIALLQLLLD